MPSVHTADRVEDPRMTPQQPIRRAYRLVVAGEVVLTSWLVLIETTDRTGSRTGWEIRTWSRGQDAEKRRGIRAKSVHRMDADGYLRSYRFEEARRAIFIEYADDAYIFSDGKYVISEVPSPRAECFLEDNNFASVAAQFYIRDVLGVTTPALSALPEGSFEIVQVPITRTAQGEIDFCGALFQLDAEGLITSAEVPGQPVAVEVEDAPVAPELLEDLYEGGTDLLGLYPVSYEDVTVTSAFGSVFGTLAASPMTKIPGRMGLLIGGTGRFNRDGKTLTGLNLGYGRTMDALADAGLPNLRYDRRPSLGAREVLSQKELTEQARAMLTHIHEERQCQSVIIGHSYGALIASELAADNDAVALLVLVSAPARTILGSIRWQREKAMEAMADAAMREQYRNTAAAFDRKLQDADLDELTHTERSTIAFFRSVGDRTLFDSLGSVTCPILILHGGEDEQVPREDPEKIQRWLEDRGQDVTLTFIPEFGHIMNPLGEDAPDRSELLEFDKTIVSEIIAATRTSADLN